MRYTRTYTKEVKREVLFLRKLGKTYHEINEIVKEKIPKATLATWCKGITLSPSARDRIYEINTEASVRGREKALAINKVKRESYLSSLRQEYIPIAKYIHRRTTALIALSMLCLGEATKYGNKPTKFSFANSNYKIIIIFLKLLILVPNFNKDKLRGCVQCRADQNQAELESYWQFISGIPKQQFYKTQVDPRTLGKPTLRTNYKGVFCVIYLNSETHISLEILADLVYNELC